MIDQDGVITIQVGGTASLGGIRVGVGNLWEKTYEVPGGPTPHGPSVVFFVEDEVDHVAGEGSVVSIRGVQWRIVAIEAQDSCGLVRVVRSLAVKAGCS